jgi:hypothetical protein
LDEKGVFSAYINISHIEHGIVKCPYCFSIQSIADSPLCRNCQSVLDENRPMYKIMLMFTVINDYEAKIHTASAIGRVLDRVIGFPVEMFISFFKENEEIADLLLKYFKHSIFRMSVVGERVISIALPKGNKINFKTFLSLQPGYEKFIDELTKRMSVFEQYDEKAIRANKESKQRGKDILDLVDSDLEIPTKISLIRV